MTSSPATTTHFEFEGHSVQRRWDDLGKFGTEAEVRKKEADFLNYAFEKGMGWDGYRILRVTITREILPNIPTNQPQDVPPPISDESSDARRMG